MPNIEDRYDDEELKKDEEYREHIDMLQQAVEGIRNQCDRMGLPHIKVDVLNESVKYSPLTHTALNFEATLNTLLTSYSTTGNDQYVSFLSFLSQFVEMFGTLTTEHRINLLGDEQKANLLDQLKNKDNKPSVEIPEIFKEAFKNDAD